MHCVGLTYHIMNLLVMYVVDYGCHVGVCNNDVCYLFVSFLSICVFMRLHMYIALVGLDRELSVKSYDVFMK